MSKRSLSNNIFRYSSALYSLIFLCFLCLAHINQQFNFSMPTNTKIRDALDPSLAFGDYTKLSEISTSSVNIPSSYISSVPRTGTSAATSRLSDSSAPSIFKITNPITVSTPAIDAGRNILRYDNGKNNGRFLYAHSSQAFAPLKSIYEGDKIIIGLDGAINTYIVSKRVVFHKQTELDNNAGRRLALYSSTYNGVSYDFTLMTCGNGKNDDSNYRLVLFLKKT